ncbi:MAG TPA: DoxX family protein [Bacteriovoracaceae bacterium]|nr:DoxX family protein [Bacteriovoracaceae bacterium]
MKSLLFRNSVSLGFAGDFGFLALRLFAGLAMAFAHGLGKIPPAPGFIQAVGGLGFPLPELFAWGAGLSEFLGGILIALGLLTGPSALFLGFTMLVAAVGAHGADPFSAKELSFFYLSVYFFFMLYGGGRFSLDAIINRAR